MRVCLTLISGFYPNRVLENSLGILIKDNIKNLAWALDRMKKNIEDDEMPDITRAGIIRQFLHSYGTELYVGLVILTLGFICFVASVVYRIMYKRYLEMQHLSIGVILGACWVLSNSVFRQFYTRRYKP